MLRDLRLSRDPFGYASHFGLHVSAARLTPATSGPAVLPVVAASVFAVLGTTASADAKKPGDWTCSDFLKASEGEKNRVVYFFEGIRLADKKETLDLAAKNFNVPVSKVIQYCRRNQPRAAQPLLLARQATSITLGVVLSAEMLVRFGKEVQKMSSRPKESEASAAVGSGRSHTVAAEEAANACM
ncbi:MAG: hypothetical protein J2P49_02725 [Methylocapsa sp.]|nr:hypothetical protein [Methylocapsa sp.]